MDRFNSHRRRRGFTFVELMVGIVVTSMVLCALSVFVFGVGENWQNSDTAQSAFLAGSMGVDRLTRLVRSAQMLDPSPTQGSLDNSTAPATCMLWTDNYEADGSIEYCEMTCLQYDQANQRVVAYSIPQTASNAATQTASLMSAASFRALPNVVETPLIHDVSACQFFSIAPTSTTLRPSLEIVLQMTTGDGSSKTLIYETATLRAPS
jgi:prepilin-type N-terminal cleavage/methylation domain-containing protein